MATIPDKTEQAWTRYNNDPRGENTLAIAVLADGTTGGGLGSVTLANLGTAAGGVPVHPVRSPGHDSGLAP